MPDMNFELTKAIRKELASLADVKGRRKVGAFMAEGTKCVLDTLGAFKLRMLVATDAWLADNPLPLYAAEVAVAANRGVIGEISSMTLAPDVVAVYDLPDAVPFSPESVCGQLVLALDRVQDPGNLGTIMRTADWMGITTILASADTADCFNPKAVQATMGAISRVRVIYGDLHEMLSALSGRVPVFGTFLDGENIYRADLPDYGVVVMGNEGRGISGAVETCVDRRLLIPSYPAGRHTSESLNVATAAAIVISQFRSRNYGKV